MVRAIALYAMGMLILPTRGGGANPAAQFGLPIPVRIVINGVMPGA